METRKQVLIDKAINMYGNILPCGNKQSLEDCFTMYYDKIRYCFWFNTIIDKSTHMIIEEKA